MKNKKELIIYQYEDGDKQQNLKFVKNCYFINKKRYLFHSEFYDIFKGIDQEDEEFSIIRVGNNKRIKNFK
jgi:hypothetical protein